jgi:hypothetical protein
MHHHRFWVDCPYCEDQYRQGDAHTVKDCIMAVLRANQWGVDNDDEIADGIIDMLAKRGIGAAVASST